MGNKYEQLFINHPIHTSLEELENALAKAMSSEKSASCLEDLEKIQKMAVFIRAKLKAVDTDLLPGATLHSIYQHLKNSLSYIKTFSTNDQEQYISNIGGFSRAPFLEAPRPGQKAFIYHSPCRSAWSRIITFIK